MTVTPTRCSSPPARSRGSTWWARCCIDAGAPVAVEAPTYLGALQAYRALRADVRQPRRATAMGRGPSRSPSLPRRAPGTRFAYLLPNFQNPTGLQIPADRRDALVAAAQSAGRAARRGQPVRRPVVRPGAAGADGARAGPRAASTSGRSRRCSPRASGSATSWRRRRSTPSSCRPSRPPICTRPASTSGWSTRWSRTASSTATCRRSAIATARSATRWPRRCAAHLPAGTTWQTPRGGMFFWLRLPEGFDAMAAARQGGRRPAWPSCPARRSSPADPDPRTMRLSFVTLSAAQIREAVAILGRVLAEARTTAGAAP